MYISLLRRPLLRGLAAIAAVGIIDLLVIGAGGAVAQAGAPLVHAAAPGYYRLMIGEAQVTALSDGTDPLHARELLNTPPEHSDQLLNAQALASPVETSVNAYLVNTGGRLILIDTGAGSLLVATTGALQASLRAAGYRPDQVDEIYLTHLHIDHLGGLMDGARRAFPNAVVRANRRDSDYWLSATEAARADAMAKPFFAAAAASLQPYIDAGKFQPFDGATALSGGIRSYPHYGHTPGHTAYGLESGGQKIMFWGDLMHVAAVQFAEPDITIKFDTDAAAAAVQRKSAYAEAAAQGYLVAGAHVSFPGIGRLRKDGTGPGYVWLPVNYALAP